MSEKTQPKLENRDATPHAAGHGLGTVDSGLRGAQRSLPRAIDYLGSTAIVVGTIIGSGIFLVPHDIAQHVGSARSLFLVWIVGAVLSLAGALSLAELGAAMPEAGGIYIYLREAYGKLFAFLYGWGMLLVINSGSIATLAVAFGIYAATFVPLSPVEQKLVAAVVIGVLTFVNYVGVRKAAVVQTVFTFAKLTGLAIIMGYAFFSSGIAPITSTQSLPTPVTTISSFGVALISVLWAYEGWHMLSFNAGEVINPSRVLPRSYFLGTLLVVVVYLGANLAYLRVFSLPVLADDKYQRVAAKTMEVLAGPRGATFVSALILCSIFGALNGNVLGGPRAYFAMARDGVFFASVGRVHPRFETPARAILIQGVWSIVLAASGSFKQLYTYVIFTGWIFYGAAALAVIVLRIKKPQLARPYRVWGYPALPVVFSLAATAIVANTLARSPKEAFIGLALVLAGVPIYFLWTRVGSAAQTNSAPTSPPAEE
jgi:APA family basic amino acid/polyamine antiporter